MIIDLRLWVADWLPRATDKFCIAHEMFMKKFCHTAISGRIQVEIQVNILSLEKQSEVLAMSLPVWLSWLGAAKAKGR